MNKYELTDETLQWGTRTLHRIRALIDILGEDGDVLAQKGELGGYVESEKNLDQDGRCWVCGDARVCDNAWVCDNAQVCGNAEVSQNDHYLTIGLIGSRDDTTTFTRNATGVIHVKCGCFYGSLDKFRAKVKETHGDSKHAKVYLMAADLAELQIDTTPIEEAYL